MSIKRGETLALLLNSTAQLRLHLYNHTLNKFFVNCLMYHTLNISMKNFWKLFNVLKKKKKIYDIL